MDHQTQTKTRPARNADAGERARLRRNQRASRARKQAYVEDLERRWQDCVKQGAKATIEMQQAARAMYEENQLLKSLLQQHGIDDATIQQARQVARATSHPTISSQVVSLPECGKQPCHLNAQVPVGCFTPSTLQASTEAPRPSLPPFDPTVAAANNAPEWDLYGWLDDLSQIKDALGQTDFSPDFDSMPEMSDSNLYPMLGEDDLTDSTMPLFSEADPNIWLDSASQLPHHMSRTA